MVFKLNFGELSSNRFIINIVLILICKKKLIYKTELMSFMNDTELHVKAACEKRDAALDEFKWKRYMVVSDLAIKAAEQAIEAAASLEGKHFHTHPRSAHANRQRWLNERLPSLSRDFNELWGAYGGLGYEGINGERAEKALKALERILDGIEKETGIRFK